MLIQERKVSGIDDSIVIEVALRPEHAAASYDDVKRLFAHLPERRCKYFARPSRLVRRKQSKPKKVRFCFQKKHQHR
jgi:hypothetical protein